MTPLFQAAVNNDFREVNETSFYSETLRSSSDYHFSTRDSS